MTAQLLSSNGAVWVSRSKRFITFCQKGPFILFLLCVRIEHILYTNTRFRYLSNMVVFTHYILFVPYE